MSVAHLPKAELHVHLEGTAPPALVRRIAERNGIALPDGLFAGPDAFAWQGFDGFLRAYDLAASVIRTPDDLRDIVAGYLAGCAREGAVYVELIASLDHGRDVGLADDEQLEGIARGIDEAHERHGITGRVLSSCLRHRGAAAAEDVARRTLALGHPYVVGWNMAGDETAGETAEFARAYAMVAEAGLGCSVHAGEHAGAASVREALALPGVTRISHGVRAVEDPAVVAELAERGVVLEVCPSSNVALGVVASLDQHPLPALLDAGVRVTLGSDDPPYFATSIGREYAVARDALGCDEATLREFTGTALAAAFG